MQVDGVFSHHWKEGSAHGLKKRCNFNGLMLVEAFPFKC